jgi:protein phosphatase
VQILPGNAQHIGARDGQEDAFGLSQLEDQEFRRHGGVLAVVADGMGGLNHGRAASRAAVRALLDSYMGKAPDEPVAEALLRGLRQANQAVLELARQAESENQVGTTAAAVVVHQDGLYWASAGDSRIYLYRAGQVHQVNQDHVYAVELEDQVARGQLDPDSARTDPDREALTSFLGQPELEQIDWGRTPVPLQAGDRILVCSDGLYRALGEAEIAARLAGDPHQACEALIEDVLAKRLEGQDNLTVVALGLDAGPPADPDAAPAAARSRPGLLGRAGRWLLRRMGRR